MAISRLRSAAARHLLDRRIRPLQRTVSSLLDQRSLRLVDVGAAGELPPRWAAIAGSVDYLGFEPDERSRAELLARDHGCRSYLLRPEVLAADAGRITFNLCAKPMCSSALIPNSKWLARFPEVGRFEIVAFSEVDATSLDSIGVTEADFIKLDTQGTELSILRGADRLLDTCLGLEVESEFQEMYSGQPLFADVSAHLVARGFEFIDLLNPVRWERTQFNAYGQLAFADALFLRSPEAVALTAPNSDSLGRYLAVCALYERLDLAIECLRLLAIPPTDPRAICLAAASEHQSRTRRHWERIHRYAALALGPA
ncbi:MAG: FkbM family methyltransferase [Actinomycetales bacterium]|nr:FkbM family methyltransferase [Actinomycetales bacterium]